jgi:hypothetical protein
LTSDLAVEARAVRPAPFLLRHRGKRHDLVGTSLGLKRREGVGAAATRGVELCVRCV